MKRGHVVHALEVTHRPGADGELRTRKTIAPPHEDRLSHNVTVRGGYVTLLKHRAGISNIKERVIERSIEKSSRASSIQKRPPIEFFLHLLQPNTEVDRTLDRWPDMYEGHHF